MQRRITSGYKQEQHLWELDRPLRHIAVPPSEEEGRDAVPVLPQADPAARVVAADHCATLRLRHHQRSPKGIHSLMEGRRIPPIPLCIVRQAQRTALQLRLRHQGPQRRDVLSVSRHRLRKGVCHRWVQLLGSVARQPLQPTRRGVIQRLLPKQLAHQPLHQIQPLSLSLPLLLCCHPPAAALLLPLPLLPPLERGTAAAAC